jgi:hypothetical protein
MFGSFDTASSGGRRREMAWHAILGAVAGISSLGLPRGVAWLTALFGSKFYSERAMRLLRRPPLAGSSAARRSGTPSPGTRAAVQRRQRQP